MYSGTGQSVYLGVFDKNLNTVFIQSNNNIQIKNHTICYAYDKADSLLNLTHDLGFG